MPIHVATTDLADLLVLEPDVYVDNRGYFFESYNQREFNEAIGAKVNFVQDNQSRSNRGVIRGLHYQLDHPQGKLVRVVAGAVFDVAVDLRLHSPTLGKWCGLELNASNQKQLWIPPGFAHGFLVLSEFADLNYKTSDYWHKESERTLAWSDETVGIRWPLDDSPCVSQKDQRGAAFQNLDLFR